MSDDEEEQTLFTNYKTSFSAIRVMDTKLVPTKWDLRIEMFLDEPKDDSDETLDEYDFAIQAALMKINFWVNSFVNNSVFLSRYNEWGGAAFFDEDGTQILGNQVLMFPDDPSDDVIAKVIQSKFNALAGGAIHFVHVDIHSDDISGIGTIYTGHGEHDLPVMEEWAGSRNWFDKPWWARDDASCVDAIPAEDADLSVKPSFAQSLDFIAETIRPKKNTVATIIKPNFRPEIIEGGKKDQ